MAYCLYVTLEARLRTVAVGLTPRALLDEFATMQMLELAQNRNVFGATMSRIGNL
jgi:hypothetical protein